MRRLAILLGLGGTLTVWASSMDFAAPPAGPHSHASHKTALPREDRALEILRRALLSMEHTCFSGEQTILTFDEGDGSACVTQETHLGQDRYRIAYQNPPEVRGQLQIADSASLKHYLPQTHTLVAHLLRSSGSVESDPALRLKHIQQNYLLSLSAEQDNVDGRMAFVLDITPHAKDRPRQKLWIDKETALVLRRETYSPTGIQTSATSWRNLHFYTTPPEEALRWNPPAGTHIETQQAEPTLPLAEARAKAAAWASIPEKLGESFYFESAHSVSARGAQGLYCIYSDGICNLSLVQLEGTQSFQTARGTLRPMPLTSSSAESSLMTSRGSVNILSWSDSHHNTTLSLLGEVTEDTLLGLAQSLP